MRKLTPGEERALELLETFRSYCPGSDRTADGKALFVSTLDSLVKKKRATVEMTDDGPRYHAA